MSTTPEIPTGGGPGLTGKQVYAATIVCLFAGLALGYFVLGRRLNPPTQANTVAVTPNSTAPHSDAHPEMTLQQMKQMADVQASTLIEKSKATPHDASLLIQIGNIYQASHQFKDAAGYFEQALSIDPKNVPARTELASCLYYSDDVDGALAQLNQALEYDPKDVNALFNLGMIKYRGKKDSAGAIAAWQALLKTNPHLDRRSSVEQLIAEAKANSETKN